MARIDTCAWKPFIVGDLFDIHPTKAYKMINAQLMDDGDNPVVVNSSYNNGIGGYSTQNATEKGGIVTFSDTTTADAIFYQPYDFVGYPHVQGMYPTGEYAAKWEENRLLFFVAAFKKAAVLRGFDYGYKFTREIASAMKVPLPVDSSGEPDWAYIDEYMSETMGKAKTNLELLSQADGDKRFVDVSEWREFVIGDLFPNIVKPPVLHARQVVESDSGIPYVVRTKFDNGIKCRVQPVDGVEPSPAGVITWGAENATFFYQAEPFLSGRDIYFIDTNEYSPMTCIFLTSCLQTITHKYPYSFGLFPDLLKKERIKLPINESGEPDWVYMDEYMRAATERAKSELSVLQSIV